ncbi:MAG: hypothetical protein CL565_00435 [Alphaproteobacteria bacterium]|nr:hypothetical protein [Alphaproteobacteria bacterium]
MTSVSFSLQQILATLGMCQALYALVYIIIRGGALSKSLPALIYFLVLFVALTVDFTQGIFSKIEFNVFLFSTSLWLSLPIISYLLSLQILYIEERIASWQIITAVFLSASLYFIPLILVEIIGELCTGQTECTKLTHDITSIFGVAFGAGLLLAFVFREKSLTILRKDKTMGAARYWLITCLICVNICLLVTEGLFSFNYLSKYELLITRDILALLFIYLVSTSLFRIYPTPIFTNKWTESDQLSLEEQKILEGIQRLLTVDKVYQDATYGRSELAQELSSSEAPISRILNLHYQKSLPQLFNEYRLKEAKSLLKQTSASIETIANETGFGSLTSFNRVFKNETGLTPTQFRKIN